MCDVVRRLAASVLAAAVFALGAIIAVLNGTATNCNRAIKANISRLREMATGMCTFVEC